jgi:hypothetical protein
MYFIHHRRHNRWKVRPVAVLVVMKEFLTQIQMLWYKGGARRADHDNEIFLGNVQIGSTNENGILE